MNQDEYLLRKAEQYEKEGQLIHAIQIYKNLFNSDAVKRTDKTLDVVCGRRKKD